MERIQYWLATAQQEKIGPLTLEELMASPHFSPDVRVWRQGLTSWVKASRLPELAGSFGSVPTEIIEDVVEATPVAAPLYADPTAECESRPERPRSYLGWGIAAIILCCMVPAIVSVIYSTYVSSRYADGDYEGARRASQTAEIWLLVSIVAGIVELPFIIAINLFG
ncbi:MAG: CD225/dispanin family protein [Paramuribaculum sp.]|nr:CD225/dispanin family protein [Paramuribaculum sp.]